MEKITLYERRRQIISLLYEYRKTTIGNLALEFEVCRHTIQNDLRVLELEYPIYTKSGAGGGVYIYELGRKSQRWLSLQQKKLLQELCADVEYEKALALKAIIAALSP